MTIHPCALIKVIKGPATGQQVSLVSGATISIGRAPENDVVIEDLDVSRHHCTVQSVPGGVVVTDLQSSNGTFVAGRRLSKVILDGRTVLSLGTFGTKIEYIPIEANSFSPSAPDEEAVAAVPEMVLEVSEERLRLTQKRTKSRTPCRIAVWCNTEDQAFPGVVTDIGTGGLALQAEVDLSNGTLVEVRPRENRYAAVRLAVRWRHQDAVPQRYGTCYAENLDSLRNSWVSDALKALGRDAKTTQERRAHIRVQAVFESRLTARDESFQLQSVNLGAAGLCLEGERIPSNQGVFFLEMGDLKIPAQVRWIAGHRCGLNFVDPDQDQKTAIEALLRKCMEVKTPFPLGSLPTSGENLAHYQLGPLLGEGGFGRVYRAYDTRLMRDVAIKILVGQNITPQSLQRFLQEARAVARVSHPGVVTIFEIGTGPRYYIVMELLHGEPLSAVLTRGPIATQRAIVLIRQVLEALAVVHQAGVVHRDLNTANIMICANDKVKVFDFGLARFSDQIPTVSQSGQVWGTPQYMAPEQIDTRFGPLDHQTDIFAACSVFYEMLTGQPAFVAPTVPKLIFEILYNDPVDPRTHNPSICPELAEIVLKGLRKPKAERHASARHLIDALAALG